jgi:hypothetical protein
LQPVADDASAFLAIRRPVSRKTVVDHVIVLDAERVLDDLGGAVAKIVVNRPSTIFGKLSHVYDASELARRSTAKLLSKGLGAKDRGQYRQAARANGKPDFDFGRRSLNRRLGAFTRLSQFSLRSHGMNLPRGTFLIHVAGGFVV